VARNQFLEAVLLRNLPIKMSIFRGGFVKRTTSKKRFSEAVVLREPHLKIDF
jgi:hypothetical protein